MLPLSQRGKEICQDAYESTELVRAAEHGNKPHCKHHLKMGADINFQNNGKSALLVAAARGHLEVCCFLIKEKANIELCDPDGTSPLIIAASGGHLKICHYLVEAKANLNRSDNNQYTALMHASCSGQDKICYLLVEKRADVNLLQTEKKSALMLAAKKRFLNICCLLIQAKSNLDAQDIDGNTALIHASSSKDSLEICRLLIRNNANLALETSEGWSAKSVAVQWKHMNLTILFESFEKQERNGNAFLEAAKNGSLEIVQDSIANHKELINFADSSLTTALICAAKNGHVDICECLIKNNAAVDLKDIKGRTAFFEAASLGHFSVCSLLVEANSNIDSQDLGEYSALIQAAETGRSEVCEFLVSIGAEKDLQNQRGHSALMRASSCGFMEVCSLLVKTGASVKLQSLEGNSAFMLAAENGYKEVCQYFVELEEDINQVNSCGQSALMYAAQNGHKEVCHYLIDAKALTNHQNNGGQSALIQAAVRGHIDVCAVLVGRRANIHVQDEDGNSAIILAAKNGSQELCVELLTNNANIDSQNNRGWTALIQAAAKGHFEVCFSLVSYDAKEDLCDYLGNSPMIVAAENGHSEVTEFFLDLGANVNKQNEAGRCALIQAACNGHIDACRKLIKARANLDHCDKAGKTALIEAAWQGHNEICSLLLQEGANPNITQNNEWTYFDSGQINTRLDEPRKLLKDFEQQNIFFDAARHGKLEKVQEILQQTPTLFKAQEKRRNNWSCCPPIVNLFTILHYAAKENHKEMLNYLIDREGVHFVLSSRDCYKRTPLLWAAREGRNEIVQQISLKYSNLTNQHDFEGRTPLILAARENHAEVVQFLLKSKVSYDIKGSDGRTALHWSARLGHSKITEMLCSARVNLDIQDSEGITPLLLATSNNNFKDVQILINSNATLQIVGMEGRTAAQWAEKSENSAMNELFNAAVKCDLWLESPSPDFTLANEKFCDVIGRAVYRALDKGIFDFFSEHENALKGLLKILEQDLENNEVECFQFAISHLTVEAVTVTKKTILMLAAEKNYTHVIKQLLERNAVVDKEFHNSWTALMLASFYGNLEAIELLFQHNADINHKNNRNDTALMLAARQKHFHVVQLLLQKKADPKHQNNFLCTPLIEASRSGNKNIVEIMLKHCVSENLGDIDLPDNNNWTALMHATWEGNIEVVQLLAKSNANINVRNELWNTPLSLAAIKGHCDLVEFFIQEGANLTVKNVKNQTVRMQVEQLITKAHQLQLHGYGIGDEVDYITADCRSQVTGRGQVLAVNRMYRIACNMDTCKEEQVLSTQVPTHQKVTKGWERIFKMNKLEEHIPTQEICTDDDTYNAFGLAEELSLLAETLKCTINEGAPAQTSSNVLQKVFNTIEKLRVCNEQQMKSSLFQIHQPKSASTPKNVASIATTEAKVMLYDDGKKTQNFDSVVNNAFLVRHKQFFCSAQFEVPDSANLDLLEKTLSGPELIRLAKLSSAGIFDDLGIHRNVEKCLFDNFGVISPSEILNLTKADWMQLEQRIPTSDLGKLKKVFEMLSDDKEANWKISLSQLFSVFPKEYNLQYILDKAKISLDCKLSASNRFEMQNALEENFSGPELTRLRRCTLDAFLECLGVNKRQAKYLQDKIGIVCPEEFSSFTAKEWEMIEKEMPGAVVQELKSCFGFPPEISFDEEISENESFQSFADADKDDKEKIIGQCEELQNIHPLLTISRRSTASSFMFNSLLDVNDLHVLSMLEPQFDLHVVPREVILALPSLIPFEDAGVLCNDTQVNPKQHWSIHGVVFCLKAYNKSNMIKWVPVHDKKITVFRQDLVFLSHRWLSEWHPDDDKNTKLKHIQQLAASNPVWKYFWIDFMCVPQTKARYEEQVKAIDSLPHFVKCCSTLITLCGENDEASLAVYRNRGWCRLEQLSAIIPLYCKGQFGEQFLCCTKHYIANKDTLSFLEMPLNSDHLLNPLEGNFFDERDKFRIVHALTWMSERLLDIPRLHGLAGQILHSVEELGCLDFSTFPFQASIKSFQLEDGENETCYNMEVVIPQIGTFPLRKKYSEFRSLHNELKNKQDLDKVGNFLFPKKKLRWVLGLAFEEDKSMHRKILDNFCELLAGLSPVPPEVSDFFFPVVLRGKKKSPKSFSLRKASSLNRSRQRGRFWILSPLIFKIQA